MEIDNVGFNTGLLFQQAQTLQAQEAAKSEKNKSLKTKKTAFASALEKAREEMELVRAGFPKEIAGKSVEEAGDYLKDLADMAGEALKETPTPENFADYRKKVSTFLKFVQKNGYDIKKREMRGRRARRDPQVTVSVVNQHLDEIARWLLNSHRQTFKMLSKVDEIKGLLVDLMAG